MLFITVFVVPSCFRVCKKLLLQLILSLQPSEESSRADELINLQPDWPVYLEDNTYDLVLVAVFVQFEYFSEINFLSFNKCNYALCTHFFM